MATREQWASAYHAQALSDWEIFLKFQADSNTPRSQALHYLQMATEKLAKAYRFRDTSTKLETLLTSHVGFRRFMNTYLLSPQMRSEYKGRGAQLESIRRDCEKLAREVESLAPAVDRTGKPGNAEYPWKDGGNIIIPAQYTYPNLSFLVEARGRMFLNLLTRALRDFSAE